MARIIIAGGRDFNNYDLLAKSMDILLEPRKRNRSPIEIVSGGARGVDQLGERYALNSKFLLTIMNADWDFHGKAAGHIRNRDMAVYSTHLAAFWDGKSRGTKNMIDTAKKLGLKCKIFRY